MKDKVQGIIKFYGNGKELIIDEWVGNHFIHQYKMPPCIQLKGWWKFSFHLESTKGGGASWECKLPRKKYFSIGEYSPMIAGYVEDPQIYYGVRGSNKAFTVFEKDCHIRQYYKYGYNQFVEKFLVYGKTFKPLEVRKKFLRIMNKKGFSFFGEWIIENKKVRLFEAEAIKEVFPPLKKYFSGGRFYIYNGIIIDGYRNKNEEVYLINLNENGAIVCNEKSWELEAGWYIIIIHKEI